MTTPAAPRAHAGVDDVLRADIRLLTTLLGQTLVRSEGQELLDLVEMVRGRAKAGALTDLPAEVDARLQLTLSRMQGGLPHVPGRDYRDGEDLQQDLLLLHDSVRVHQGELLAAGGLDRLLRTAASTGLLLATWMYGSTRPSTTMP